MAGFTNVVLGCLSCFLVVVAVSGSVGDNILTVPLFEVGSLWVRATKDLGIKLKSIMFQVPDFYSPWTYLVGSLSVFLIYTIYCIFLVPLNRTRLLGELGYATEGKLSQKDMVNVVRKRRQIGDLPPVYPNGWFAVYESRFLKKTEVVNVSCLGKNLAVFRSESGEAYVVDAYCPHLGANLAVGGRVFGDCIECPFHGWQFRGEDGKCVKIPTIESKNIPCVAKVTSYTVLERNGFIFIWYHAEGVEPTWTPPEIEQIASSEWTYRGRTEHMINCHIEEVPENGADVAHLGQVHGPIMSAGIDLRYMYSKIWSFGKHLWAAEWSQNTDADEKHVGTLKLTHSIKLFGFKIPVLDMDVTAKQIGPRLVLMMFDMILFGKGSFVHVLTPLEPLTQRMIHHIYANRFMPTWVAKFLMISEALMVERDIMIWNNKKYEGKPVFVKSKEDSLINKHRRWYSQFYSENSPKIKFQKDTLDW